MITLDYFTKDFSCLAGRDLDVVLDPDGIQLQDSERKHRVRGVGVEVRGGRLQRGGVATLTAPGPAGAVQATHLRDNNNASCCHSAKNLKRYLTATMSRALTTPPVLYLIFSSAA